MTDPVNEDGNTPSPPRGAPDQSTMIQQPVSPAPAPEPQDITRELGVVREAAVAVAPLQRLGEYELLAEVGRGGMGVVFKARHVRLQRVVALKMILGGVLARPEDLQRFETEAAASAQLQHPHIVALYEIGTHESQPFLTMEYVSGSSLAQRVGVGVLPARLAASYVERLARAVHYAHGRGVIHRDLKPANVLFDEADEPKITDFGLAKVLEGHSGQTRTGAVVGTPSYMAPEQAGGRKDVGPACDVYSLGAILYELVTGSPPFRGETALATLALVAEREPVTPRVLNPRVDRELETICLKCLEKEPSRRYASAEALADDLRRFLDGEPIAARRVGVVGRAVKWVRRKPAAAALLFVSVAALVGFSAFQWRTAEQERALREDAETHRQQAEAAGKTAQLNEQVMRHLAYMARMRQAHQVWAAADLGGASRLLLDWVPRGGQQDLRDWEWYYLRGLCQGRFALAGHEGRATAVTFSADGKLLASAGGQARKPGEAKLWDAATGRLVRTLAGGHRDAVTDVAFRPDGKVLATASEDRTVALWGVATGVELMRLRGHGGHVASVAFSPDGRLLVSGGGDRVVRVWDVSGAEPKLLREARGHGGEVTSVAFSPDGKLIASAGLDETVRLWDPATGDEVRALRGHEGEVMSLAFSPGGKLLVSGGGPGIHRGQVKLWDVATGQAVRTHFGLSDRVLGVAVSRAGRVAAAGSDGMVQVWDERVSSEPVRFRGDVHLVYALAFGPDELLACAGGDGRVRLWNADGGQQARLLPAPPQAEAVAFAPDSKVVACAGKAPGRDGEVQLWSLETGNLLRTLRGHAGQVRGVAFDASGRRVATAGDDHTARVHDLDGTAAPLVLKGHEGRVAAVAFQPKGSLLASAADDDTVRLWDARTGKEFRVFKGDRTGQAGHKNGALALAFSPDGKRLATGSYDRTVRVWDVETGESFALEGHGGSVHAVAFSPSGTELASGGSDRTVRVWDLAKRVEVLKLEGSSRSVASLAYHPGGWRLASVGNDRSVRIWDLLMRQEILELSSPLGSFRGVAFSPDGRYLAAAGHYAPLRVWEAPRDERRSPESEVRKSRE